jgi:peroxiredoxin
MLRIPDVALIVGSVLLPIAHAPAAESTQPLEIGKPAPEFDLPGVDGKNHSLADFGGARVLVVVFTCNHCPTAQAYEERLIKLHEDYKDKGVALVAISPNDPLAVRLDELGYTDVGDSLEDMKLRAKEQGFTFSYLYDGETQQVSREFGVLATPHVFIFDVDHKLRYQGRLDDSDIRTVKSHDARNAIDALLAGEPVPVETTRVFGCSTKWSDKRADAKESLAKWDAEPVELEVADAARIETLIRNETENYRLINVWSITCIPCIGELPELVTINRMYRKRPFELITICMDPPDLKQTALKFLEQHHVSSTNLIFASDDKDALAEALDAKWQGPVPYTILVAPGGEIVERWTEEIDPLTVKRAIVDRLGRTYASRKSSK